MKVARLLVTENCNRDCDGCCNKYERIMGSASLIDSVEELPKDLDAICITGGEPLLDPHRTAEIIHRAILHTSNRNLKVYLYTALFPLSEQDVHMLEFILLLCDGIQFSLHYPFTNADNSALLGMQHFLVQFEEDHKRNISKRLYVDARIRHEVAIKPALWQRIRIAPWMSEDELINCTNGANNGLPPGETLYILKEKN